MTRRRWLETSSTTSRERCCRLCAALAQALKQCIKFTAFLKGVSPIFLLDLVLGVVILFVTVPPPAVPVPKFCQHFEKKEGKPK